MEKNALTGGFTSPPVQSATAFRAALNALARPGRIEEIRGATAPAPMSEAAATLLLVLCDPDTPLHLAGDHDRSDIRDWIAFHIGAPLTGPEDAAFALGRWDALSPITRFPIGTPDYPDRSTTLIVELERLSAQGARLTGPGIETTAALALPELAAFQANHALFPQGLDFFFTCDTRIAGLPRSTILEAS